MDESVIKIGTFTYSFYRFFLNLESPLKTFTEQVSSRYLQYNFTLIWMHYYSMSLNESILDAIGLYAWWFFQWILKTVNTAKMPCIPYFHDYLPPLLCLFICYYIRITDTYNKVWLLIIIFPHFNQYFPSGFIDPG